MKLNRTFASLAVFAGMALSVAPALSAQDWDAYHERRDIARDRRDLGQDYANTGRLRADIARDQWRRDQDLREGRPFAAGEQQYDINQDRRALGNQYRDINRDRTDIYRDRRDLRHDNYYGYR